MTTDFSGIEAVPNANFKGGEGQVLIKTAVNDGRVRIMQLTIPAGASIGMHRHTGSSEEILVLQGIGHFLIDDGGAEEGLQRGAAGSGASACPKSAACREVADGLRREDVAAGSVHYCPDGAAHTFVNDGNGPVVFFAVVAES